MSWEFLFCCRKTQAGIIGADEELESALEIMLTNVNPNLACEIKECWIDPDRFSIGNMVGRGKFKKTPEINLQIKSNQMTLLGSLSACVAIIFGRSPVVCQGS